MKYRRLAAACVAICVALSASPLSASGASAASSSEKEEIRISGVWTLDLWHHSGGYWRVGNAGSEKIRISDEEMGNIGTYLEATNVAVFSLEVPGYLADLINSGARGEDWEVRFESRGNLSCSDLFSELSPENVELEENTLKFSAFPIFNFSSNGDTLGDFIPGMMNTVPLVDKKYGCNIYSVFGNGRSAVQGAGYYNEDNPFETGFDAIHPSFIQNVQGELEGGHRIRLGLDIVDSDAYRIGSGTFINAGACGLHFEFPISLVFSSIESSAIETGDAEDSEEDSEEEENPEENSDSEDDDSVPISLEAQLSLPERTYVGHPTVATDYSVYRYGEEVYAVARAAALGLGSGEFSLLQPDRGNIVKSTVTKAIATFTRSGSCSVKLTHTAKGGEQDSDIKSIEVLRTPSVSVNLGGVQKENRKQSLQIRVAQNPESPVCSLSIVISETSSGESVRINKVFSGVENAPNNSAHIKYRSIYDCGSDKYFLCLQLDFLTKWHSEKKLRYEVYAQDIMGNSDSCSGEFVVLRDEPPFAAIEIADAYYRGENSNEAEISVEDISTSDGDSLIRRWSYMPEGGSFSDIQDMVGYRDRSFGAAQRVSFIKSGTGNFKVRLHVKETWVEESLPEYISEKDYLSDSCELSSRVDNIAPRVGLELAKAKNAELLLLAEGRQEKDRLLALADAVRAGLAEKGIATEIKIAAGIAASGDESGSFEEIVPGNGGQLLSPDDLATIYDPCWRGMWRGGNISSDSDTIYILNGSLAVSSADPRYNVREYPYTISAYAPDFSLRWKSVISRAVLASDNWLCDAKWGHDTEDRYLYLCEGSQTAIFLKASGAYITTLSCALGEFNALSDDYIYSFTPEGILRVSMSSGEIKTLYSGFSEGFRIYEGKIHFMSSAGSGKSEFLYRGIFDPGTEELKFQLLPGSYGLRDVSCIAMDAAGCIFVSAADSVLCYDAENILIKCIELSSTPGKNSNIFPVWTSDARIEYIGQSGRSLQGSARYGYRYLTHCNIYGVYTNEAYEQVKEGSGDWLNFGKPIVYALQDSSGAIGVYMGGAFVYTGRRYLQNLLFSFRGDFDCPLEFPVEFSQQGERFVNATANGGGIMDVKQVIHKKESRNDEEIRLKAALLSRDCDYSCFLRCKSATDTEELIEAVNTVVRQGEKYLALSPQESGAGTLSTEVFLEPDTVYYYEYDTDAEEDILSAQAMLLRDFPSAEGYSIDEIYREDFEDGELNPFFSCTVEAAGGRYRIGYLETKSCDYLETQLGRTAPISFCVPEGKRAVLEFGYEYDVRSGNNMAKYILLTDSAGNKIPWEHSGHGKSAESGNYMHPRILDPGKYSLSCVLKNYTKTANNRNNFFLEDLNVYILGNEGIINADALDLRVLSSVQEGAGDFHISGSFRSPRNLLFFGRYDCEYTYGANSVYSSLQSEGDDYNKRLRLTINPPAGRKIIYSALDVRGRGGSEWDGECTVYYTTSWSRDGRLAGLYSERDSHYNRMYRLYSSHRFSDYNLISPLEYIASFTPLYFGYAGIKNLEMYIAKSDFLPSSVESGRFFVDGSQLCALSLSFPGKTAIKLQVPENRSIKNLRIYSVHEGIKTTVLECPFTRDGDLERWSRSGANAEIACRREPEEEFARVYAKGEAIDYRMSYSDFEGDPSKRQHWVYAHEALNDGIWVDAGKDFESPVSRFYIDGKYTLRHSQEDSTGNTAFDKSSNIAEMVFYIKGGAASAPWVTFIRTNPSEVKEGEVYNIKAGVDDREKDILDVKIELYKYPNSSPTASETYIGLAPAADGNYPVCTLQAPRAEAGTYDVVVSVKDHSDAGMDSLRFKVKEGPSLSARVDHTPEWEANRIAWNEARKGTRDFRAPNVFWPGEALMLFAEAGGNPRRVKAEILEFPQYTCNLSPESYSSGKIPYAATLWDASMLHSIGISKPVPATVRFIAYYEDGSILIEDVSIIFDQSRGAFHQLHRLY